MEHHDISLLRDIALGIIFATILSHIARILKQPLILGYILGGVLLGKEMGFGLVTSEASIELISEIGLILLLFIIGLEINLTELAKMGKSMFTLGILPVAIFVVNVKVVAPLAIVRSSPALFCRTSPDVVSPVIVPPIVKVAAVVVVLVPVLALEASAATASRGVLSLSFFSQFTSVKVAASATTVRTLIHTLKFFFLLLFSI